LNGVLTIQTWITNSKECIQKFRSLQGLYTKTIMVLYNGIIMGHDKLKCIVCSEVGVVKEIPMCKKNNDHDIFC